MATYKCATAWVTSTHLVVACHITRDEVVVRSDVSEQCVEDVLVDVTRPLHDETVVVGINRILGQHESIPGGKANKKTRLFLYELATCPTAKEF